MKNWNSESFVSLMYQSTLTTYKRNDVVYNIGDPCDFIYFIKQGEVEVNSFLRFQSLNSPFR